MFIWYVSIFQQGIQQPQGGNPVRKGCSAMGRMQNDMFLFFVVEWNTFLSRNNPEGLDRSGRFVFSVYLEVIIGTWVWGRNVRDGIILSVVNLAVSFREAVFHTPGLGLNRNLQTAIIIARIGHLGRKPGALFHLFCLRFLLFRLPDWFLPPFLWWL